MRAMRNISVATLALLPIAAAVSAQEITIKTLDDLTGGTANLGVEFSAAKTDVVEWINANGGINGKKLKLESVDYGYKAPTAIMTYKRWTSEPTKPPLIFGYGTADTEALSAFVTTDKIPFLSQSFSAKLSDPTGKSGHVAHPTPYNFVYGPTYPDACRGVVAWAMKDWKARGQTGKPKLTYMADNYPSMMGYRDVCLEGATELGFEILPTIQYSLKPGDFKAQCLTLRESGANYAFLANPGDSSVALLKSCATVDVKVRFLGGFYSYSELTMKGAGNAANGVVIPLHVTPWGANVPGMQTVKAVTKGKPRTTFYMANLCTFFYAKEAMEWADKNGGLTGDNVRRGFTQKKDWVPNGLEGVCAPATWSKDDYRSVVKMGIFEGQVEGDKSGWKQLDTIDVGRDAKWWGR